MFWLWSYIMCCFVSLWFLLLSMFLSTYIKYKLQSLHFLCRSHSTFFMCSKCFSFLIDISDHPVSGFILAPQDPGGPKHIWGRSVRRSRGRTPVSGLGMKSPRSWSVSAYIKINLATAWKDMAPLKLFQFGKLKAAVYAFYGVYSLTLGLGS